MWPFSDGVLCFALFIAIADQLRLRLFFKHFCENSTAKKNSIWPWNSKLNMGAAFRYYWYPKTVEKSLNYVHLKDLDWRLKIFNHYAEVLRCVTQCTPSGSALKTELRKNRARLFLAFCLTYSSVWQVVALFGSIRFSGNSRFIGIRSRMESWWNLMYVLYLRSFGPFEPLLYFPLKQAFAKDAVF